MFVSLEKRTNLQRWMSAKLRNQLTRCVRMRQTCISFAAEPADDWNAIVSENHQRIMRISHNPSEFRFHDLVQKLYRSLLIKSLVRHIERPVFKEFATKYTRRL